MADRRKANQNWQVADKRGNVYSWENASVAVLMDIRDELQRLNNLLNCYNFMQIPAHLKQLVKNTRKRNKKRVRKPVS